MDIQNPILTILLKRSTASTRRKMRAMLGNAMVVNDCMLILQSKAIISVNITEHIELEYNQTRIQKDLGYKTPRQMWFDYYRKAA